MIKTAPGIYGVIYSKSLFPVTAGEITVDIPDGADEDIKSAQSWYEEVIEEENRITIVTHSLNVNDYWIGHFFYNDMERPEDACIVELNSREHLDSHWESNNAGGHYDCVKYEHIVNGNVIETINHTEND